LAIGVAIPLPIYPGGWGLIVNSLEFFYMESLTISDFLYRRKGLKRRFFGKKGVTSLRIGWCKFPK
jgi:hypothetical protein